MKRTLLPALLLLAASAAPASAQTPAQATEFPAVLVNHLGYDAAGPKHAAVRGFAADDFGAFAVLGVPSGAKVFEGRASAVGAVDRWKNWRFWTIDFDPVAAEGMFTIEVERRGAAPLRSFPFRVQKDILERHALSDVLFYLKGQRCTGLLDKADRTMTFDGGRPGGVDVRGGWYDATGDYGIHFSHLDFSTYFNPQQVPMTVYSLLKTLERIQARDTGNYNQYVRRLLDEAAYGADFLVRMRNPAGSFWQTISGRGPEKKPEDRRIAPTMKAFRLTVAPELQKTTPGGVVEAGNVYETSFRSGGGIAIAALAMAARLLPAGGDFDPVVYRKAAEDAFAWLQAHNRELTNDGKENILDDYCALAAASELFRTTGRDEHGRAARARAESLVGRLAAGGPVKDYWRADDTDRPFFHAVDAGLPVVSLLGYVDLAPPDLRPRVVDAVRRSLECELRVTAEVPNAFGLARQYVQSKAGARRTAFFYPHDSETAPWWQGENARLASLAAAARMAAPLFPDDPAFARRLRAYAADQLNWILGLNPFDACMLDGTGRNNPEYVFFGSYRYANAPGGICNGITGGYADDRDIDLAVPFEVTRKDEDWRWAEQWLPHGSWFLMAVALGGEPAGSR